MRTDRTSMAVGIATALLTLGIAVSAWSEENGQAKQTEVVVIATHHFVTDMTNGYTPGHLRALLTKVSPDLLLVEAPSNVAQSWEHAPIEVTEVLKPWAERKKVVIVPCGWHDPMYQEQVARLLESYNTSDKAKKYHEIEQRFQQQVAAQPPTCCYMNGDLYQQVWRLYQSDLAKLAGQPTPWQTWNTKILENVVKTCKDHPGKRVAVVFGGAHVYFIQDGLANEKSIKLICADKFLPLTEQEVAMHNEPGDYLRAYVH